MPPRSKAKRETALDLLALLRVASFRKREGSALSNIFYKDKRKHFFNLPKTATRIFRNSPKNQETESSEYGGMIIKTKRNGE